MKGKNKKGNGNSFATRKRSVFTTSRNCCAPTACSRRTCSTSWKKTKSSSWTNIPGAKCRGGDGATGCIRRCKQSKQFRAIAKRKPSLPIRDKTNSYYIKNWLELHKRMKR